MLKYLLLLCLCSSGFAQVQSLAEYNRSFLSDLITKKTMSAKEIKALRIRLGTEMTSADDATYKEGELLKLLEYTSYMAFYSKNKEVEKIAKTMWESYLKLPNPTGKTFQTEYLADFFTELPKNPDLLLPIYEYFLKYATRDQDKRFFFPLISDKCECYSNLRRTEDLERCWKQYFEFSEKTPKLRGGLKLDQVTYYYSIFPLKAQGDALAKEIMSEENFKGIHPAVRRQRNSAKINNGDLNNLEAELDKIKREDKDGTNYDRIYLKTLLVQNKTDMAIKVFKGMVDKGMNSQQLLRYYKVAAELFYKIGEFQKSEFYVNKMIEIEQDPLNRIDLYVIKAAVGALGKSYSNVSKLKPEFEKFSKIATDYKLEDPEYLLSIKLGQIITAGTPINTAELAKVFEEYKKYQYPKTLIYESVEKLLTCPTEKPKDPATK